jgi:hypothetical protein
MINECKVVGGMRFNGGETKVIRENPLHCHFVHHLRKKKSKQSIQGDPNSYDQILGDLGHLEQKMYMNVREYERVRVSMGENVSERGGKRGSKRRGETESII